MTRRRRKVVDDGWFAHDGPALGGSSDAGVEVDASLPPTESCVQDPPQPADNGLNVPVSDGVRKRMESKALDKDLPLCTKRKGQRDRKVK